VLAARVEQQQVAVAQPLIVVAVVHDAGVGAAADDRMIGEVRIVRAKLVQISAMTSYSMRPGRTKRMARRCAPTAIWAARRSFPCSARLLYRRMSSSTWPSATNSWGTPEPWRACTRMPFTQPTMRGSNSRCAPME
jgi:hypothetical protein